ncbi:MAG: hypothetical protein PVG66_05315 [Chromatiales bacterium]|jgi:hypothetical protein
MARIDSVTAPLAILFDDGSKKLAAACFPHQRGLLYLDPFWHLKSPDQAAHLIHGELSGEGPWRIAGATIRVLGCHNTDPELQHEYQAWQTYLSENPGLYPPPTQVTEIARKLGAIVSK